MICKGVLVLKFSRWVFVFIIVFVLVSCGSDVETDGFSIGFMYDSLGSEPAQEVFCGFHTSKPIDDGGPIEIDFYIGIPEYTFGSIDDTSSIIIYVTDSNGENRVNLYTITNFNENDFTYNIVENNDDTFSVEYTYSMEISIPESMFSSSEGMFEIGFEVLATGDNSVHFSAWNIVSYIITNDKIELLK